MFRASVDIDRAAGTAQFRGAALLVLGCVAVRWPQNALLLTIVAAGALAGTLGIIEVAGALASKALPSSRAFYLGEGLAFVGFGALTVTAPVVATPTATTLASAWLLVYSLFTALLAARVWHLQPARLALIAWTVINLALGVAVRRLAHGPLDSLLYWGALYTALLGFVELSAGMWISRRYVRPARRDAAAARARSPHAAAR